MYIETPKKQPPWGLWITVGLVLILCAAAFFLIFRPIAPQPFQVVSFTGRVEIFSPETNSWNPVPPGAFFNVRDKIRTQELSDVTLRIPGSVTIRVKEKSELHNLPAGPFDTGESYHLQLERGRILGATGKNFDRSKILKITTPVSVAAVRGTLFDIEYNPEAKKATIGVLQGKVKVGSAQVFARGWTTVGSLESTEISAGQKPMKTVRISQSQWTEIKEAYELFEKSATFEAEQQDLSRQAGNFFKFVFDHGTFYMPRYGFADREFIRDPYTQFVSLGANYDVFPKGSFVGLYFKTRSFDLSKFEKFTFQARRVPGDNYPEEFRIEFKSKGQVIRGFAAKLFKKDWLSYEFNLSASKETPVNEVTFVFGHDRAGEFKKGALQFREFKLIPKEEYAEEFEKMANVTDAVELAKKPGVVPPAQPLAAKPVTQPAPIAVKAAPVVKAISKQT